MNQQMPSNGAGEAPPHLLRSVFGLYQQGALQQAAGAAVNLLKTYPRSFSLWTLAGAINGGLGRFEEAETCARRSIELRPDAVSEHYNLGFALQKQNKVDEAIKAFDAAIALDPRNASAYRNRGALYLAKGDMGCALDDLDKAVSCEPNFVEAIGWRGNIRLQRGELDEALADFQRAIGLRANFAPAYCGIGVVLFRRGQTDGAIDAFQQALRYRPDFAEAFMGLANALYEKGELTDAVRALERAQELDPSAGQTQSMKLAIQAFLCDFEALERATLTDELNPFVTLFLEDNPANQQKRAAHTWRTNFAGAAPMPLPARPKTRPARLRVGYFSADFHDHATLYLMSGLLREHDSQQFDIHCYSYGTMRDDQMRPEMERDATVHDVQALGDEALARLARSHGLDVAVDLKGYTNASRSNLFAWRLAPVQVNYLGYPGTLGTDTFDYIVADHTVITPDTRPFYTEHVIYLPHSYQPNDNRRSVRTASGSRGDLGLPQAGFVFCCFNNANRIGAREFGIWMRVLSRVEGSVLWLLRTNAWVETTLRERAAQHGVDPARLVFGSRAGHEQHQARHGHADLFLDTFNYNAHTTASDALWAGLPIVTKAGQQFSARVAASLLNAVGLPELITETDEQYEARILQLATDMTELRTIRERLMQGRLMHPLFDTERYTRNLERGFRQAYDRYLAGDGPTDISVPDQG